MTLQEKIKIRDFIREFGIKLYENTIYFPYKDNINLVLWCGKFLMHSDDTFKWMKGMDDGLSINEIIEFIDEHRSIQESNREV